MELPAVKYSSTRDVEQVPAVSVLMITYNQAAYVSQAITGVLAQRLKDRFELVIGEDCSTDGTREIVESFRVRHPDVIRVLTSSENVGMNENLRRVALAARGPHIAFCEGDDVWHYPDKLATQLAIVRHDPSIGMVYSDYDRAIQVFGRWRVMRGVIARSKAASPDGQIFEALLDRIPIHLSTMLCSTRLVTVYFQSDLYDPDLRLGDVPLLLFCAAHAGVAFLPVSTSVYRSTPNSVTNQNHRNRLRLVQDHVSTIRRYEERFVSDPVRRCARAPRLDALVATAAYAAGNGPVYAAVAGSDTRARLRAALIRAPALHRTYMAWVAARQRLHFWKVSEDAPWMHP
jgi:glycosyltransferase involved in cell wall biosynthesis